MTNYLAPAEPYRTRFETSVATVSDSSVTLETTYFYAESGGQPADRGTVGGQEVIDVRHDEDTIVHELADPPPFETDDTVTGQIDEAFRTYCMRAHTASHVVYGAGRRLFEDLGYGGFDIGSEKVRVDLTTPSNIDDAALVDLERLANRAVWESRDVVWRRMAPDAARSIDGIAFNTKTEEGVLAHADEIRVVEIDSWDVAACGGTHVKNTKEIGPIQLSERSNPGKGLTRIEFAVGPPGIKRRSEISLAARRAAAAANVPIAELPDAIDRLQSEIERIRTDRDALRERLIETRIAELQEETIDRAGGTWIVGTVDDSDANELGERAEELAGDAADVIVFVGADDRTFLAVGAADDFDAAAIVREVTAEFGGGGGGSTAAAQGGGIDATPQSVVEFLRSSGDPTG